MADAGVALAVLPSTDLYLMGRHMQHSVMCGVTDAHKLLHHGVNCTLSTNNVLNPFTLPRFTSRRGLPAAQLPSRLCSSGKK